MSNAETNDQKTGGGAAGAPKTAARATTTVTVACKLPHGVVIRDHTKTTIFENVLGGGTRAVDLFRPIGPRIRIKGPTVPTLFIRHVEVVGGYAITEGVPADVFARWIDWNADSAAVRNNLIYGHEKGDRVRAWAREHAGVKSGLEPLNVDTVIKNGRQMFADERVVRAGADHVLDGALKTDAA